MTKGLVKKAFPFLATRPPARCYTEPVIAVVIRLLPSRVGFAERDASRPAFGGSSLVSLTRHTCVGGGPIGGALSVRPCVRPRKSATTAALSIDSTEKKSQGGGGASRDKRPRAERSERVRRGACSISKMRSVYLLDTVASWSEGRRPQGWMVL